jgi:hypothetical protein
MKQTAFHGLLHKGLSFYIQLTDTAAGLNVIPPCPW